MLTLVLLSLGFLTTPGPLPAAEEGPPTLMVQVVDPVGIPLPDSEVTVKLASGKGESKSAHADDNGYAKFWVQPGLKYTIEAKTHGFNKKIVKNVLVKKGNPPSATAHVQIKLQPTGPFNYSK